MKLEEIPDGVDESAMLSPSQHPEKQPDQDIIQELMNQYASSQLQNTPKDGTAPDLPPGLAAVKDKPASEVLADLNKMPLFMTSLEENDELEAMKALAYEGTPLEVALGFKERGNESYKEKGWKDAKEFYGQGIQVLLAEVRKRQKGEETTTDKDEVKKEIAILEASLVNRAACHLELKNYRSCIMDCGSAIKINRKNIKAYYRSAKALLALDKNVDADDACKRGLEIDPENKALQDLSKEITKKNIKIAERRQREVEREKRRRQENALLNAALEARNIKTRKTAQPPDMEDVKVELVPDPLDPESSLNFPTLLMYPLSRETDMLKAFNELHTLKDYLPSMFPAPWDKKGEYTPTNVECYMETVTGGLVKVGRKASLLKILSESNVEVVDDLVKIYVVPKAAAESWIKEFKADKAARK